MNYRLFSQIVRLVIIGLIALLLFACLLFAILQTKWAKEQIRSKLVTALQEHGIAVKAEELGGQPPFTWTLKHIELKFKDQNELKLCQIKLRIAIFPLLRGRLTINYLHVEQGEYVSRSQEVISWENARELLKQQLASISLPCQ